MPSPWHGLRPPYELPSNIVYFHDWRYVNHGSYRWRDQEDKAHGIWATEPAPPLRYDYLDIPLGIRLEAKPAQRGDPVLTPGQAQTIFLFGGTLIQDQGRYRLWYECWPGEDMGSDQMGNRNYVRYAESDDGMSWRFPELGLIEYQGGKKNNLVIGPELVGPRGYHGGSIFFDPSAPPESRYKTIYLGRVTRQELENYRQRRPEAVDPFAVSERGAWALLGGVSPDGLRFQPLPEILVVQTSDTHNVCEYDARLGKYVAYCRSWYFNRRTIGRIEAAQFGDMPLPEEVIWPGPRLRPSDLWYNNGKTRMPGTSDYHLMFPMRWSLTEDKFDFYLASSPDNINWQFVSDGPIVWPGPAGTWDGGVTAPGLGLVDLPGQRTGMLVAGSPVPHKHPRHPPLGALGWAWWPRGRLVALKAEVEGSFALWPLTFRGRTVRLNFSTSPAGFVQVEALGADGKVLPGRSFADFDVASGNHLDHLATWKGQSDLGHAQGSPVTLRFRMRTGELFSVAFA